jgi:hypothetical protein
LSKKRSGTETFFSTTVQPFMPQFRISEHYYGKRYKGQHQVFFSKERSITQPAKAKPATIPIIAVIPSILTSNLFSLALDR